MEYFIDKFQIGSRSVSPFIRTLDLELWKNIPESTHQRHVTKHCPCNNNRKKCERVTLLEYNRNSLTTAEIVNNNHNNIYNKRARVKPVWQITAKLNVQSL